MIIKKTLGIDNFKMFEEDNNFYLSLSLIVQCDDGIYKMTYPKIDFPIDVDNIKIDSVSYDYWFQKHYIDLGLGKFEIFKDDMGVFCNIDCVKKFPPRRMTQKEIESKLGYKIELINEEDKISERS